MNGNMIDFQGKIQQNHGLQTDYESGFGCSSSVYEFNQPMIHLRTNHQNYTAGESSSPIINRFRSPESAFFAAERFMGIPPMSFQAVADPGLINFQEEDSLQSVVKPRIFANQSRRSIDKPLELSSSNLHGGNLFEINSPKMQPPRLSPATASSSSFVYSSSKTRIRWTQDLHEKFVDCVNHLGGAEKATPKAILKLMDSQGLTILHVKSHLQKYRIAKYIPDSAEGSSERRSAGNEEPGFDMKTGQQIKEALQLQLHVQWRLHEQLEIQKRLQLQIEEQGRRLKMMFDEQQKTSHVLDSRSPHS